jgi:large subunit ribosomal protein L4
MADNTTPTAQSFQASAYTAGGTARDKVALPETLFDGTVNMPVMHQAVKAYLANQRQGNAATKIRKYVTGGNQKPWKQKGTGRARQGSTRAPHWVGGGTVFGPIPRSYAQYVPRQVRALARKSAFNARAREDAIVVIDQFNYDAPKTSRLKALVDRLGVGEKKVLILTDGAKTNVFLSGRNLPSVHVMPYGDVSTYHLLWSDVVLIEATAIGQTLAPVAEKDEAPKREKKTKNVKVEAAPAKKAAKKTAKAEKAPAKKKAKATAKAKAPAKKTAAKKPAAKPTKKKGK